jgi:hypothetical protein
MSHLARLVVALALGLASLSAAETTAFGPGEQVVYRASFLGIPAGSIQVTVGAEFPDTPGVWPIVLLGRSDVGLFFFPIRDKMVLRWDAERSQTRGMEMWADENHKHRHLRIVFDHAEGKAKLFRQLERQEPVQEEISVKPDAADVASALYLLRTRPLEPGTELTLPVVTPSKQFPLRAVVEGREQLKTPLGEQATVRVRMTTDFSGKLKAKSDLVIYFTDDAAHVPVRIEAELGLGTVVAEAVEFHSGSRAPTRPAAAARTEVH